MRAITARDDQEARVVLTGHMTSAAPAVDSPPTPGTRWRFVDSLRGFALFGILLVNTLDITRLGIDLAIESARPVDDPVRDLLTVTVQTRFVPIFVFLFGMSLWFVLAGARSRSPRPGLVMVRRLVGLVAIGGLLMLVYPGNVLLEYGVVGLVMLPIVVFAPRWATLALGAALTVAAYALTGGGLASTPGLMLLGAGAAAYGLPRVLESAGRGVALVFAGAAVLTVPALLWQATAPGDPRFSTPGSIAGLVMAVAYATALALLWRTPARRAIAAVFEPLGRMALTNYVVAAIVVAGLALVVDFGHMASVVPGLAISVALIAVQSVLSRLWLARFVYGPVEWAWRSVTWWRPAALVRRAS